MPIVDITSIGRRAATWQNAKPHAEILADRVATRSLLPQLRQLSDRTDRLAHPLQDGVETGDTGLLTRAVLQGGSLGEWALGAGIAEALLSGGELGQAGK